MKNNILVVLLISVLFISCDDKNNTNFETKNYIAGTWIPSELGNINSNGKVVYTDYVHATDCNKDNLILNDNFSYEENSYSNSCVNTKESNTYRYETGILYLNSFDDVLNKDVEFSYNILSLTYTELELSYTNDLNKIVFVKFTR